MGVSTINILILQNTIILIIFELSTSLSNSANRFQKGCWESRQAVQLLWFLGETTKMRLCGLKLSKRWRFLFSSSQHCLLPKLGAVSWFTVNSSLQQLYASWQDVTPGSSSFSLCRQEFPGWFLLFFCRFSRCTTLLLLPCGCIMVFLELFFFLLSAVRFWGAHNQDTEIRQVYFVVEVYTRTSLSMYRTYFHFIFKL